MCIYIYIYIYVHIYQQIRVSSCPGLISVAHQNVCGEQQKNCSHQCSPECSMNKFRACIYIYINFVCLYLKMSNHNLLKRHFI